MAWSNFACFGTWYKGKHYVLFCGWRPRLSLLLVRCSHIVCSCSSFILILSLYMPWFIYPWCCWQGLGEISSLGFYFGKTYSSPPLCFFFSFTSDTSGHQMCGIFPHIKELPMTPAGCPTTTFTSDTNYLEIVWHPTREGLCPIMRSLTSDANHKY